MQRSDRPQFGSIGRFSLHDACRLSQAVDLPLKSATFKRDATGKWYVSLVAEFDLTDLPKPSIETETAIGIDVGFDRFATEESRRFQRWECQN